MDDISLAGAPVLTAALISLLATLLFGVAPGLAVAQGSLASPRRIDTRAGGRTRQRRRLQQTLIAAQTALAVITLAGAGLLIHSLERLERLDLGFNPSHLSVFSVRFPIVTYDSAARNRRARQRGPARLARGAGRDGSEHHRVAAVCWRRLRCHQAPS
jgi:putative ABC transport system permease protein